MFIKKGYDMTFQLNDENFMITGYRGDSASFTFEFNEDISNSTVCFFVKKNINDSDDKAILKKEFVNPSQKVVDLRLLSSDTVKLGTLNSSFRDYYWSLKMKVGDGFVQTLIPNEFSSSPIFRVYP